MHKVNLFLTVLETKTFKARGFLPREEWLLFVSESKHTVRKQDFVGWGGVGGRSGIHSEEVELRSTATLGHWGGNGTLGRKWDPQ